MPVEPPSSRWGLTAALPPDEHGVVGVGADLEPGTLLAAYRNGMFPMPVDAASRIAWWSPDPRAVLPLDALQVSRSLRRSCRRYEVRVDSSFAEVIEACADPQRSGGWITRDVARAYTRLHELGWAHSVEAWDADGLAGGLYGVAVGGLFAGESMFQRRTDASKVALVALVALLRDDVDDRLLDVQWTTDHLGTLGAVDISRTEYLRRLAHAVTLPLPSLWA